jgi:molybdenum cofactor cytidylyltransferase
MIVYVILAAGASSRMGHAKAVTPLGDRSALERLHDALPGRALVVVTRTELRNACAAGAPSARVLVNERPQDGMSASLRVADEAIDAAATIAVIPADKPFVRSDTVAACELRLKSGAIDVLFPVSADGEPGHPVYFGPAARAKLARLPRGDTLHRVRDDASLRRAAVFVEDAGAFRDLDTPEQWRAAQAELHA